MIATLEHDQEFTIGRILQAYLPNLFPGLAVLDSVVKDLELEHAVISLAPTTELRICSFVFHVADEMQAEMEKLVLRKIKIIYSITTEHTQDESQTGKKNITLHQRKLERWSTREGHSRSCCKAYHRSGKIP